MPERNVSRPSVEGFTYLDGDMMCVHDPSVDGGSAFVLGKPVEVRR